MNFKGQNVIIPLAIALILPLFGILSDYEKEPILNHLLYVRWIVSAIVILIIWYFLKFLNGPRFNLNFWQSLLIIFTTLITLRFVSYSFGKPIRVNNITGSFFAILLIQIIQYYIQSQENIAILKIEKEKLISENYKSQLKVLRAQIDPHFLFNSLNTLRSMVRNKHENSERFVMSLSDFYRQTFKNYEVATVPLSEEISVLESYLFLMKNRNENGIKTNINIDEHWKQYHLPALALQVSVENCFKHNSITSNSPLIIDINTTSKGYVEVKNNIQPKLGDVENSGKGIGILRKRYQLMNIPMGVQIDQSKETFIIQLKLIEQ